MIPPTTPVKVFGFTGTVIGSRESIINNKPVVLVRVQFDRNPPNIPLMYRCEDTGYAGYREQDVAVIG